MADIVLSAGVRQNLLALQSTADLMSQTQNRLATGKKINSALDNPGAFFTSQALSNRASDLNALLDSIGQAQQVLKSADTGITSLTKLVESAKSIAKQAQQAPGAGSSTYNAINVAGTLPTGETIASVDGAGLGGTLGVGNGGNLVITVGTTDHTIALADGDDIDAIVSKINAVTGAAGAGVVHAENDGGGQLRLTAMSADVSFTINASSDDNTTTALGLAEGVAHTSTSLLDLVVAEGGSAGDTLTIAVNGGASSVITLGTGAGEVSTMAELQAALNSISGITGTASGTDFSVGVGSSSSQNSILLSTSSAELATVLGISQTNNLQGTQTVGAPNTTRTSLESDFNNVLSQIDTMVRDASYNGINLLNGDDFKVVFNETGTSFLMIAGVSFDTAGLGLTAIGAGAFQDNGNIDTEIAKLDTALATLRNQASKFGSTLTTVQIRQDFTKNLINTLQTGADNLVLADTNAEGANLLALQTRQQLSTTALSLSAQADQAVLRLFG